MSDPKAEFVVFGLVAADPRFSIAESTLTLGSSEDTARRHVKRVEEIKQLLARADALNLPRGSQLKIVLRAAGHILASNADRYSDAGTLAAYVIVLVEALAARGQNAPLGWTVDGDTLRWEGLVGVIEDEQPPAERQRDEGSSRCE